MDQNLESTAAEILDDAAAASLTNDAESEHCAKG